MTSTDTNYSNIYDEDEFIFCKTPTGEITSCGFSVNSELMRKGKSPIMSVQNNNDNKNQYVSDLFKNLAIPAGICHIQQQQPYFKNNIHQEGTHEEIPDDIFDKLLSLAKEGKNNTKNHRRYTRKAKIIIGGKKNKSKKNK